MDSPAVAIQVASETPEVTKTNKPTKAKNPEKLNVFRGSSGQLPRVRLGQVPEAGVEPALDVTLTGF